MKYKYGIIANPISGKLNIEKKKLILDKVCKVLGPSCIVDGLNTRSSNEFVKVTKKLAKKAEILIIAGGDGTITDVINAAGKKKTYAYLPFGTGNFMKAALKLPRSIIEIAKQIKKGKVHYLDLILVNGKKKCIVCSVGLGSLFFSEREKYLKKGLPDFLATYIATMGSYFWLYKRMDAKFIIDRKTFQIPKLLSLIVSKTPIFSWGFKGLPEARLNDGYLHMRFTNCRWPKAFFAIIIARFYKNILGTYEKAKYVRITTNKKIPIQIHGDPEKPAKKFTLKVLPKVLKIIY